jgi:uncharacterized protein (TIGR02996 family)
VTDEKAFLQAVIADPDDDSPRLIYADWLDEQGQCERAEFIRVQIAVHGSCESDDPQRFAELRRRERRLLRRYAKLWFEPLRPIAVNGNFNRGFVEQVVCYPSLFVKRGETMFSLAPIRWLWLPNAAYCSLLLSQCPHLNRPLFLNLRGGGLKDKDISYLANSRFLGRLTGLDLDHNQITGTGALTLARSPYLGSLDDLYLKGNDIPREARTALRRRFGSRVHF